jgi:hypothetical protein
MHNAENWIKRATDILTDVRKSQTESVPFAVSFLTSIYGAESPQLKAFNDQLAAITRSASGPSNALHHQSGLAVGAIQNTVAELQAGLILGLRTLVAGEIFGELVGLARQILAEQTEATKNVAAVLVAAAFEDIIRRMGAELGGVAGRPDLQAVIVTLKDAGVLKGGEIGTAQSYLKFRNDSLHADWANVQRSQVDSCLAFIEALLVNHFS